MNKNSDLIYENGMMDELRKSANKLSQWFNVERVKWYAVYVWTPNSYDDVFGENVFDIYDDRLNFYPCTKPWQMPNDAITIIHEIQEKMKEIEEFLKE